MSSLDKTMDSSDSEHAKIHGLSSVIVATIVTVGVIVAAAILAEGDYGTGPNRCMTTTALKVMANNTAMDVMIMNGDKEIGMQRARYDYDKNTIVVESPAIANGFNNATIAIDYDRSVVFINIHEEDICFVSALTGDMVDMAERSINFMGNQQETFIDISNSVDIEMNYQTVGLIAAGYVTNSNGPIIRAMCAGDESHWTKPRIPQSRTRRRSGRASVRFCIFGFCFNINF